MKALRNTLLTVASVVSLGLSPVILANPMGEKGPIGENCPITKGASPQQMERIQKLHDERTKALEDQLKLKPEQQTAWKTYTAAQDAHHKDRAKRWERPAQDATAPAIMEARITSMETNLTSLKTMAKALGDLYTVLDADQKKVMDKFCADQPKRGMMMRPKLNPATTGGTPAASPAPTATPAVDPAPAATPATPK